MTSRSSFPLTESGSEPSDDSWAFCEPAQTLAYTSSRVLGEGHPVLLVVRSRDGDWQFLHGPVDEDDRCRIVTLGRAVARDPSLQLVADLPKGWRAYRSLADGLWFREPSDLPLPEPVRRRDNPRGWAHWLSTSSLPSPWLWK
ncbi:hypothetical protein [Ideonella oryzae]|uniref:DUF2185 domain-containing protein n=1 Tax=Ideonella oryzae TaxID=2937441 RepID=A0ABT1BI52_9BURK|nr:hypothetical protein [Ideonella oryzae]MCO5975743.1 hypothetical protein [Ideonella oryzae]